MSGGTLVLHAWWSAANVDVAFDAAIDCAAHQRPVRHCQLGHDTTRYDTIRDQIHRHTTAML